MDRNTSIARTGLILLAAWAGISGTARAACVPTGPSFSSLRPGSLSYVTSGGQDARNLRGAFWALGAGDPATGQGHDNGTWPPLLAKSSNGYYGYYGWAYSTGLPDQPIDWPMSLQGSWGLPPAGAGDVAIDGCIDDVPDAGTGAACMAMLLAEHAPGCESTEGGCVSFAYLTAAREGEEFFFDQPDGGTIEMGLLPPVNFASFLDDGGSSSGSFFIPSPAVPDAVYLDPACGDAGVVGYRVYQFMGYYGISGTAPLTLESEDWQPTVGGGGPDDAPIPLGESTTLFPGCEVSCFDAGLCPYFAYTLVFDSGYELPYLTLLQNVAGHPLQDYRDQFLCCQDRDADGSCGSLDCDDTDPLTYPGAPDLCDGIVHDCNDPQYPGPASAVDLDGDGFCSTDCADWSAAIYPGAPTVCDGLLARDCNQPGWPMILDAVDHDGDGFSQCSGDCDDHDPTVYPEAPELCDGVRNRCSLSQSAWEQTDRDNDGDGFSECEGDCNDEPFGSNPGGSVYPGAPEVCGPPANDCDAPDWPTPPDSVDDDGDGFAECDGDCDDAAADVFPGAAELCDGIARDCGAPGWPAPRGTTDGDGDGLAECEGDCDDSRPDVHPGMIDVCNGLDDDCSGGIDEGLVPIGKRFGDANAGAQFGIRIARVNPGDNIVDGRYVVGARGGQTGLEQNGTGTATVFWGAGAGAATRIRHPTPRPGDRFGSSVEGIGDVDGDGLRDIVVGAESDSVDDVATGSAHVYSGVYPFAHLAMLVDPDGAAGDRFGYNAAALGDVDGDGTADLIVGARGDDDARGSATVFSGADFSVLGKLTDPLGQPGDLFGYKSAGIGDVDGDDVPDILVSAYAADSPAGPDTGKVLVFSGADLSLIRTLYDPDGAALDGFGRGLAVLGDVSGDGVDDVIAGAPGKATRGSALLVSTADGTVIDEVVDPDGAPGDLFGYHVAAVGDLDGDGLSEILVGAFDDDTAAGANAGSVTVFFGRSRMVMGKYTDPDPGVVDLFGFSGVGVDDLDGDGVNDLVIGAYLDDHLGVQDRGSVTVYSGYAVGDSDGDLLGDACDPDRDGDGHDNDDDCRPLDPSVWSVPPPVGDTLVWSSDKRVLWWQPVERASGYRVYQAGSFQDGRFVYGPGDWSDSPRQSWPLTSEATRFYLVAAENACGVSHLGTSSAGDVRELPDGGGAGVASNGAEGDP